MIDIKVPTVGESISEVTLLKWNKKDGDYVERDEVIAELESEKATFEVNAEKAGTLKTVGKEGDTLNIGDVIAQIDDAAAKPEGKVKGEKVKGEKVKGETEVKEEVGPKPEAKTSKSGQPETQNPKPETEVKASPVASAMIADKKVDP